MQDLSLKLGQLEDSGRRAEEEFSRRIKELESLQSAFRQELAGKLAQLESGPSKEASEREDSARQQLSELSQKITRSEGSIEETRRRLEQAISDLGARVEQISQLDQKWGSALERQQQDIKDISSKIADYAAQAAARAEAATQPAPPPEPAPSAAVQPGQAALSPPSLESSSGGATPEEEKTLPAFQANPPLTAQSDFSQPIASAEPSGLGTSDWPPKSESARILPDSGQAPLFDTPRPAQRGGRRLFWVVVALVLIGGLAYVALFMPMPPLTPSGNEPGSVPAAQSPLPAPELDIKPFEPPSASLSQEAIHLVKETKTPSGKTLAEMLEGLAPATGGLSPWMAEKITDDLYQVNFYAVQAPQQPPEVYEFEAKLSAKSVVARNQAAKSLMEPAPTPAAAPRSAPPSAQRTPASRRTPPGATQSKAQSRRSKLSIRPKARDNGSIEAKNGTESLDDLLLPGIPKNPGSEKRPAPGENPEGKGKDPAADAELLDNLLKP